MNLTKSTTIYAAQHTDSTRSRVNNVTIMTLFEDIVKFIQCIIVFHKSVKQKKSDQLTDGSQAVAF